MSLARAARSCAGAWRGPPPLDGVLDGGAQLVCGPDWHVVRDVVGRESCGQRGEVVVDPGVCGVSVGPQAGGVHAERVRDGLQGRVAGLALALLDFAYRAHRQAGGFRELLLCQLGTHDAAVVGDACAYTASGVCGHTGSRFGAATPNRTRAQTPRVRQRPHKRDSLWGRLTLLSRERR